jgi:phosphoglycolate phosphatase-like HAD superfamily hydrolase
MIRLIIFDWDDVFTLGSKEGYIRCLHETLQDIGVELDREEEHRRILATWSKPHRDELEGLLLEHPELIDAACDIYEKKFFGETFTSSLSYVAGANELLLRLRQRYTLAVATGAHPDVLRKRVMPRFKVPDVFAQIVSGYDIDDPGKQKPNPYMLQNILTKQGASPDEAIMVGDARSDVLMARSARIIPVVVLTGHLSRQEAEDMGVEYIIDDVTALEQILKLL